MKFYGASPEELVRVSQILWRNQMTNLPASMNGKRGLVMGIANERSIAWSIAENCATAGAEMAFTYQGEALRKRVMPLAARAGVDLVLPCDVSDESSLDAVFEELRNFWNRFDFVVHAIAYSDKEELKGRYIETSQENFTRSLLISCYSFTAVAQRAEPLLSGNSSVLTLTYYGAERVMPHYNVMGVAKAALEASVRYLAMDLGPKGIRGKRAFCRSHENTGRIRNRRFSLHPEMERIQLSATSKCS